MAPEVPKPVAFKSRGNSLSWMDRNIGASPAHSSRKLEASPAVKARVKGQLVGPWTPGSAKENTELGDVPTPRTLFSEPSAPPSPRTVFSPPASVCSTPSPRPGKDLDYGFLDELQRLRASSQSSSGDSGSGSPHVLKRFNSSVDLSARTPTKSLERLKSMGSTPDGQIYASVSSPIPGPDCSKTDLGSRRRRSCSSIDSIGSNGQVSLLEEYSSSPSTPPLPQSVSRGRRWTSNLSPLSEIEPVPASAMAAESRRLTQGPDTLTSTLIPKGYNHRRSASASADVFAQQCIREYLQTLDGADLQGSASLAPSPSFTSQLPRSTGSTGFVWRSNTHQQPQGGATALGGSPTSDSFKCRRSMEVDRANTVSEGMFRAAMRVEVPDDQDSLPAAVSPTGCQKLSTSPSPGATDESCYGTDSAPAAPRSPLLRAASLKEGMIAQRQVRAAAMTAIHKHS